MAITVDGRVHIGTLLLATAAGKVTGEMHVKQPSEITGKVAGTTKAGETSLDFPYHMVERNCDGQIAMRFKAPAKGAGTKGTVATGTAVAVAAAVAVFALTGDEEEPQPQAAPEDSVVEPAEPEDEPQTPGPQPPEPEPEPEPEDPAAPEPEPEDEPAPAAEPASYAIEHGLGSSGLVAGGEDVAEGDRR